MNNIKYKLLVAFIFLLASCTNSINKLDKTFSSKASAWVFINTNIVDVEHGVTINNRDVFIENGIIKEIVRHDSKSLNGYQLIPAENLFLSPGLIDSHVHIYSERDLILYVANGVTGVQNMWGFESPITLLGMPDSLKLKKHIQDGGFGPWIWTSGPIFEGETKTHPFMNSFTDKESAEKEVIRQQRLGYDFIKTYDWLSRETFSAILAKSKELTMPVKGHVPYSVTVHDAITQGLAEIEHLTGWIDIDSARLNVSELELGTSAELAAKYNVSVCPSLLVFRRVMLEDRAEREFYNHPYRQYLSWFDKWIESKGASSMRENVNIPLENYPEYISDLQERVLLNLINNNVNIVACTDAGNPYVYPGISLHEEMSLLQDAHISSDKILKMATVNAAFALGEQNKRGKIKEGFIADLILMKKNPLQDINHLQSINGVMLRGKWFYSNELSQYMQGAF